MATRIELLCCDVNRAAAPLAFRAAVTSRCTRQPRCLTAAIRQSAAFSTDLQAFDGARGGGLGHSGVIVDRNFCLVVFHPIENRDRCILGGDLLHVEGPHHVGVDITNVFWDSSAKRKKWGAAHRAPLPAINDITEWMSRGAPPPLRANTGANARATRSAPK